MIPAIVEFFSHVFGVKNPNAIFVAEGILLVIGIFVFCGFVVLVVAIFISARRTTF